MELNDKGFPELLKQGNEQAFEKVFTAYYPALHAYAFTIVADMPVSDEMVQNVFLKLWAKRDKLEILTSLKAYLYKSIYNECMDYLKNREYKNRYKAHALHNNKNLVSAEDAGGRVAMNELEKKLQNALNDLPDECRTVFQLSRFEGLKYQEIATHLGLSVKTVEAQMGKALRRLRLSLAEFISILIFFLWIH
ncbi:MAG TPA: RNA polymerase sigma-70 factor [Puia sp.]|nr:RNA polymerase sigma-70 factor [Puia sp.]